MSTIEQRDNDNKLVRVEQRSYHARGRRAKTTFSDHGVVGVTEIVEYKCD